MTEHLLFREDFTGEIHTYVKPDGVPIVEITTVGGWTPVWREDGGHLRPEMHVIDDSNPNYLEPVIRLNAFGRGITMFKQWGLIDGGYYRQIVVPAGTEWLQASLRGHCWYSQVDQPVKSLYKRDDTVLPCTDGMRLWIGIDREGGTDLWADTVEWSWEIIFDVHDYVHLDTNDPGPLVTVFIRADNDDPFKHVDAYFASVDLYGYTDDVEPEPELDPEGPTPGGYPAAAMVVDYDIITDEDRRQDLYAGACELGVMVGPSHDHVRAWPPGAATYTVTLWDIPKHRYDEFRAWYQKRSPEIVIVFAGTDEIPDPDPDPDSEPSGPEPQYALRSDNLIGLHSGFMRAQSMPYIEQSGTCVQKFFSAGDAYLAALKAPGIVSIWRKYVGNEQGRIWQKPTIRESARWYLDQYTAEIETARRNMGLTLPQFLARPLTLESLNETIPTFNTPVLEAAVEFDVNFSELGHERYGWDININLCCGAIGNPHESEVPMLLPAATEAARWGDFLGYHAYWTANANANSSYLADHWPYHAGRWMEWDVYFRSKGVYPRYASGEGGIVYAWDGQSFDSGKGWKACGSFEKYLLDINDYNARALSWNRLHGNRCAGLTLFGYGNWGWDNFEIGDGDVILLNGWATGAPLIRAVMVPMVVRDDHAAYIADLKRYIATATYVTPDNLARLQGVLALEKAKAEARYA